jgi:hypothetical protein
MGLRKLMGMATTMGGAGYVISNVAEEYTGVTKEMMDAYKRSFAAEYNKNSNLSPATNIKDGIFKFVNSSYADVFDFIKQPIRSALSELDKIKSPKDISEFTQKAIMTALSDIIEPFVSTTLGIEPILDTIPQKLGGRGGRTKLGNRVYSETDDDDTVMKKSIAHVLKAAIPGLVVSFDKYGKIGYDYYTDRNQPNKALDTFLSLISGNKIQRVDLYSDLDRKIGQFERKLKGELTASEPFYSDRDWQSRGPKKLVEELRQIHKESFKVQQEVLQLVTDARTLGISEDDIYDIMKKRIDKKYANRIIFDKEYVPYKPYKNLFEKKYEKISRDEKLSGRGEPNYDFIYPIDKFIDVEDEHYGLDLRKDYDEQMQKRRKNKQSFVPTFDPNIQVSQAPTKLVSQAPAKPVTPPLPKMPEPALTNTVNQQVSTQQKGQQVFGSNDPIFGG